MYLGGAVVASRQEPRRRHCGGKAGYTLNRVALHLAPRLSGCSTNHTLPVDQQLARCLEELVGIQCTKTVDHDSALRYMEFGLDYQAKFAAKTKKKGLKHPIKVKPLAEHHGIYIRDGLQGIASDAVSFSVANFPNTTTTANTFRRVDAILKRRCQSVWDDPLVQALDADGRPGYIHDATYLRRTHTTTASSTACKPPFGTGPEGKVGYQGLQKIQTGSEGSNPKKVLCLIYTHSGRHDSWLRAIAETYGPRCDGFLAASNQTDPSLGAVHLLHEGPETCKSPSLWKVLLGLKRC